ncbi:hypothetical protein L2E82_44012 [Cichorium intybus]|uniref:Uncharacterized protein n=1 Tax=Cichorium intybus TaxID=13427 RepID=A0ACB8ZNL4_CICIN|nr:hypothetical protein L2E82_44012 [Cichorium intybus]
MGSDYGWSNSRNLGKSQLGGVIFGTKKTTINECLSKQLFGLPNQDFVYVKKIDPGLPLFLFNYTERTLFGIFKAASSGQMNIDPYTWNTDGSQRTPYPAQLKAILKPFFMQDRRLNNNSLSGTVPESLSQVEGLILVKNQQIFFDVNDQYDPETLRKELEVLKNEVTKAEAATSVVGKKYDEISKRERELQITCQVHFFL